MTELARVFALTALASALLLPVAKREKELAQVISGLLYLSVFLYATSRLGGILDMMQAILDGIGDGIPHADVLLRTAGISLSAAAASALCEENGQRAAAHALELLGVIEVILAAQPILTDIFGLAEKMLLK